MGMIYWMNEGIGVRAGDVRPYLNKEKCIELLRRQLPDEEIKEDDSNIEDYTCGDPFDNLGEFLWAADDTNKLTYGDDGYNESFLYYPPSYPWDRTDNEPKSIKEVHEIIIKAIKKVTDLTDAQIETIIDDDLYEGGCG